MANKVYPPPPHLPSGHVRGGTCKAERDGEGGRDVIDDRCGSLLEVAMFLIMASFTPPDTS